ncbi:aminotransferase class IV [Leucobacter sp. HY1908]
MTASSPEHDSLGTPAARSLVVADSFRARLRGGTAEVRGFSLHLARFRNAVLTASAEFAEHAHKGGSPASHTITEDEIDEFLVSARTHIAEHLMEQAVRTHPARAVGSFPRLELWDYSVGSPQSGARRALDLALELRPLPEIRSTIEVTSVERRGAVTHPHRKGPNIELYASLMRQAGGEVLLVEPGDGAPAGPISQQQIIEGTTTSLVWWDKTGAGFTSASHERVPSVAEAIVSAIASRLGTPLKPGHTTPAELASLEVWAVNALHGIRPVIAIDGVQMPIVSARFTEFRDLFDQTWEPVLA